jgi:hypothetical protein
MSAEFHESQHINAVSMGADITPTYPFGAHRCKNIGAQFVWTGTPTGTLFAEASNDANPERQTGTWEDISSLASLPSIAGSAGHNGVSYINFPYKWLRFRYVRTSGTGTLTVTVVGKGGA